MAIIIEVFPYLILANSPHSSLPLLLTKQAYIYVYSPSPPNMVGLMQRLQ